MTEIWYVWRVVAMCGEDRRFLIPWSDPMKHEQPFDVMFVTPEGAREGLRLYEAEDDAKAENWVLCRLTLEPVGCIQKGEVAAKMRAAIDGGLRYTDAAKMLTKEELFIYLHGGLSLFKLKRLAAALTDADVRLADVIRELSTPEELITFIMKARFGDES